jgi:hypothetical protein
MGDGRCVLGDVLKVQVPVDELPLTSHTRITCQEKNIARRGKAYDSPARAVDYSAVAAQRCVAACLV